MLKLPGHKRYDYLPITKRQHYSWPGGKRLAFYIALNIEHFAFQAGLGMDPHNRTGTQQTSRNFAWRDYGNRVGNWRFFEMLDELKLPASILLNSTVCYEYPEIVEKIKQRGDDVLGHGRTNAELLRGMWEEDERRVIQECVDVIEKHVGVRPTGWMGAGAAETNVTVDLLKECGFTHLLDWPVDDQPIFRDGLAALLIDCLQRFDRVFEAATPYMLWIHQRPFDNNEWPHARLHVEIVSPWRTAGVPRYIAAGELGSGVYFNPVSPESAAQHLRDVVLAR